MMAADGPLRKPRIAIMGEFSAGKSTLSNLLLGRHALPEKVTATRLPPVWLSAGSDAPYRVTTGGRAVAVHLDRLEEVPLEDTLYVKLAFHAETLDRCDLIDFPGISDPNMDPEVWQRMLGEVDAVLWCTHATQAWRQSEAAAWDMVPENVRRNSLLLVTRFDKLTTDHDRMRVVTRVARETVGLFAQICPISLTRAIAATDAAEWQASGAEAFSDALEQVIARAAEAIDTDPDSVSVPVPSPTETRLAAPLILDQPAEPAPVASRRPYLLTEPVAPEPQDDDMPRRIVPRRVKPAGAATTPRPDRADGRPMLQAVATGNAAAEPAGRSGRLRVLFN